MTPLVPDGYFELTGPDGLRAMFLEVDQGTEPLRSWQRKVQAYLRLAISGEFQQRFHQDRFRVLVVAGSGKRLQGIRATVLRATDKIFWFSTFASVEGNGFWSQAWLRPQGDQSQTLLPLCAIATAAIG